MGASDSCVAEWGNTTKAGLAKEVDGNQSCEPRRTTPSSSQKELEKLKGVKKQRWYFFGGIYTAIPTTTLPPVMGKEWRYVCRLPQVQSINKLLMVPGTRGSAEDAIGVLRNAEDIVECL